MLDFSDSSNTFNHLPLLSTSSFLSHLFLLPWTALHQHPLFSPAHHYPFTSTFILHSSPQHPYQPQRHPFPCCWTLHHWHVFSEFVTQARTHPVSWKVICWLELHSIFSFFLPVSIPVYSSIKSTQPTVWLYLGSCNSFHAFHKDPLNFTPNLSELLVLLLALSTPPSPQQISEHSY